MVFSPHKKRIGILRGGPSPEFEVSLKTGKNIIDNMPEDYHPVDIFISKDGVWHIEGIEKNPSSVLRSVDMVINAMHGSYGEDGTVQKILEEFGIPYSGSNSISSAISMNKILSKKIFNNHGLKTPFSINIPSKNLTREVIRNAYHNMPGPFVVKPSSSGSSVGVYLVNSLRELEEAVIASSDYSPSVMIEQFIEGKEATCGVIDGFRNQDFYPLIPIEIKHKKEFFDYDAKYKDDATEEICPGNFSPTEYESIKDMAIKAHRALGLRHYSRSDFIVHPKRGVYILETNSLPGLTEKSLIPKSLQAIGSNIKEFISHIISKTLNK